MEPEGKRGGGRASALATALDSLAVVATLAAVLALSFLSGGYPLSSTTPAVVAFLAAAVLCVWLVRRWRRASGLFLAALAALAAFTLWTGVSLLWSIGPDLTWVSFNLTALYLTVFALVGLAPVRTFQLRLLGVGFVVVCVSVAVYAYLGKLVPDTLTHALEEGRLASPLGYWNALALLMIMGMLVALAFAGDARVRVVWRSLAAMAAVPLAFTFFFTYSRGGFVAFLVALVVYFALTTTRLASLASLVAIALPVAGVLWRLRGLETVFSNSTDEALQRAQGGVLLRWSLLALVVAALLQAGAALLQGGIRWPRWSVVAAGAVCLVVVVGGGVGVTAAYTAQQGGASWVKERVKAFATDSGEIPEEGAGRLASTTTWRPKMWKEALEQSEVFRISGAGGGTFPLTHYRFRPIGYVIRHAHNQWLNVLSELGVIGVALFTAAIALAVAAAAGRPIARRRDPMHPLVMAVLAVAAAFIVHMLWDWGWDMGAVGVAVFLLLGGCAAYSLGRREEGQPADDREVGTEETAGRVAADGKAVEVAPPMWRRTGWAPRTVATLALFVLAVSWMLPYLADRAESNALLALGEGRLGAALQQSERAGSLNPLAVDPLVTQAQALQRMGRSGDAVTRLTQAVETQPDNYVAWYHLGLLQATALTRPEEAQQSFERALGLNPLDAASLRQLKRLDSK